MPVRSTLTDPVKSRWYDANSIVPDLRVGLTMAVWPSSQMGLTQDASTMSDRQESPLKTTPTQPGRSRTTPAWQCGRKVRCQRGNLAKTLRRHFGSFYDRKKIGNSSARNPRASRGWRIERGRLTRAQVAPNTFSRIVKQYDMLQPLAESENEQRLAFAKVRADET